MRAFMICMLTGTTLAACTLVGGQRTVIDVEGRAYDATYSEERDPVTGDLIEVTYLVNDFDITCTSRAQCARMILEAETARAEALRVETATADGDNAASEEPLSALSSPDTETVEVSPLTDAADLSVE